MSRISKAPKRNASQSYTMVQDRGDSPCFSRPLWMKAVAIMIMALSGIGECKTINARLGGLPKAITLLLVLLAILEFLYSMDFKRARSVATTSFLYILFLGGIGLFSLFIWTHNFSPLTSMVRGIEKISFQGISVIVAISLVYLFGEEGIDVFTAGICLANLLIMGIEMPAYGLSSSIRSLVNSILSFGGNTVGYAEQLEIHEMTFLYGMLILYYMFFASKREKRERVRNLVFILASVFFLLVGLKRIMLPALVLGIAFVFVFRNMKNLRGLLLTVGILLFVSFFAFMYAVASGILVKAMSYIGIDSMGRGYIWGLARQYYDFSPSYMGLGFEAVDAMVQGFYSQGLIDVAYPLHNDILKVFIELGFWGFVFWSGMQYIFMPMYFYKRYGHDTALLYMGILLIMTVTYLTDNTAFYFWCTMALRLIPMAYSCRRRDDFDPDAWVAPTDDEMKSLIEEAEFNKAASGAASNEAVSGTGSVRTEG